MAHLKCNHCENFTDEAAYPFCEDCQDRDEYDDEGDEDDGSSYWTETDEHRTY